MPSNKPRLTIASTGALKTETYADLYDAHIEVTHGDALDALRQPLHQYRVRLALDHRDQIAKWALAPKTKDRWATVELSTEDRQGNPAHTHTLHHAYVHDFVESDFPPDSGSGTDQGNYIEVLIRGVLPDQEMGVAYTGINVHSVKAGAKS